MVDGGSGGVAAIGVVEVIVLFVGTYAFLRRYALPSVQWVYYVTVFIAYFLGIGVAILLPIDIAVTESRMRSDDSQDDESGNSGLADVWAISYWVTWVLAWIAVPILQEYWAAGQFSFKARLRASLKANCKAFAVGVIISIVALIWMAIKSENPLDVLMGLSNFYALILIVLLMSYGMVEIPRSFWRARSPENLLDLLHLRASDIDLRLFDAEENLKAVMKRVSKASEAMKHERDSDVQRCWTMVMENVTLEVADKDRSTSSVSLPWSQGDPSGWKIERLAKLNADLRMCTVRHQRAQAEWTHLLKEAEDLENIINKCTFPASANAATALGQSSWVVTLRSWHWSWRVYAAPRFNFAMAFLTAAMSAILLWCEITIPIKYRLSIFGAIIRESDPSNAALVQLLALVPLSYAAWCTYSSLVKLKIPFIDALTLHDNRSTDSYALLFNAAYLSRLQFGLGANFLMMLQYDSSSDMWPTAFRDFVGKMNVDVLGDSFAYVFPLSMLVIVVLLYFKIYDRFLTLLGVDLYVGMGEPLSKGAEYLERVKEGKMLVRTGRRKKERVERRRDTGSRGPRASVTKEDSAWTRSGRVGGERRGGYAQLSDDDIL